MSIIIVVIRNTEVQKRVTSVWKTPIVGSNPTQNAKALGSQMVKAGNVLVSTILRVPNYKYPIV